MALFIVPQMDGHSDAPVGTFPKSLMIQLWFSLHTGSGKCWRMWSWVLWLLRNHYHSATEPSLGMVEQELCSGDGRGPFLRDGALPLCAAKDLLR